MNAYVQSGKATHLAIINDNVSKQLTPLSIIQSLSDDSESQEKISYIDSVVDSTINGLSIKKENLDAKLTKISSLTEEQAKKLNSFSKDIEQKKSELSKLTSDWQNQFSSAQESRSQEFSKWRDAFVSEKNKEVQEIIDKHDETLDSQERIVKTELDRVIEDSKSKHQSILDLYELTAGDSVGAAYIQSADNEKEQANRWRNVSVGFIGVTVIWLVFSFFYNSETWSDIEVAPNVLISQEYNEKNQSNEAALEKDSMELKPLQSNGFSWHAMLIAFSISGVLLWGAAYSAQQSTRHRNIEKRARWFALEVKAFDPFINSLELTQQQELKKQLAERIFGQNSTDDEDSKVVDEHALRVVTDALGKVLSKLPK
ncbi:hypothetical protein SAMN05421686_107270 [Thalassolituus maritimus]|uniref:Uncharacterized protein n=1 Tax=Thalassolituus maritimus TaxID=484498 RepID=A0A1N7NUJ1_9GAMM|nr:hypothetical protein [Thalassolituus maritimus]SIT02033.1 hypothetical protein SAMN05421686_107270 [Thalassolituus maritimus]